MTDTTTNAENTQVGSGEGQSADATTTTTEGATLLTGAEGEASKTAEGAEAGAKGADAGQEDKSKQGEGDDGKKEAGDDKAKDDKPAGPPEKYEFTMPDGMELDTELAEKVDPVLRELNLTNEQANKLAGAFAEYRASEAQRQSDAYTQQVEDWGKSARDDKEFGGATFDENVKFAQKAIGQFGTPELKALLEDGLGNHPELIRFAYRIGKSIGEDGGVDGSKATTPRASADVLFDHPTSKKR